MTTMLSQVSNRQQAGRGVVSRAWREREKELTPLPVRLWMYSLPRETVTTFWPH